MSENYRAKLCFKVSLILWHCPTGGVTLWWWLSKKCCRAALVPKNEPMSGPFRALKKNAVILGSSQELYHAIPKMKKTCLCLRHFNRKYHDTPTGFWGFCIPFSTPYHPRFTCPERSRVPQPSWKTKSVPVSERKTLQESPLFYVMI